MTTMELLTICLAVAAFALTASSDQRAHRLTKHVTELEIVVRQRRGGA